MNPYKILVVDDESRVRDLLKLYLMKEGYTVYEESDGSAALQKALNSDFDLIILDLMLPGIDGIELCSRLREKKTTPVLILTARDMEEDRLNGFKAGADDYVTKPFSSREVIHRVHAIINRTCPYAHIFNIQKASSAIILSQVVFEPIARRVKAGGTELNLTMKEYDLFYYLAERAGNHYSREHLLMKIWKYESSGDCRTVDTHIKRLREKLNAACPGSEKVIYTTRGYGYGIHAYP